MPRQRLVHATDVVRLPDGERRIQGCSGRLTGVQGLNKLEDADGDGAVVGQMLARTREVRADHEVGFEGEVVGCSLRERCDGGARDARCTPTAAGCRLVTVAQAAMMR